MRKDDIEVGHTYQGRYGTTRFVINNFACGVIDYNTQKGFVKRTDESSFAKWAVRDITLDKHKERM